MYTVEQIGWVTYKSTKQYDGVKLKYNQKGNVILQTLDP